MEPFSLPPITVYIIDSYYLFNMCRIDVVLRGRVKSGLKIFSILVFREYCFPFCFLALSDSSEIFTLFL